MATLPTDQEPHQAGDSFFEEKRREERFPLPIDVELLLPEGDPELPEIAELRDMSENGVGFEHYGRIDVGDVVTFRLLDTPIDLPCEHRVKILWQKQNANGTFSSGGQILPSDE